MGTSWHAPAVSAFVERLPALTKKGANRTKGRRHVLAPCDVCWEPTWVEESNLKVTWACPECRRSSCRRGSPKTPICEGRTINGEPIKHEPIAMTTTESAPGMPCRMTPGCPGRHRRDGLILERTKEQAE